MDIIKIENVKFKYNDGSNNDTDKYALNGISLNIKRGEFTAILGHNS